MINPLTLPPTVSSITPSCINRGSVVQITNLAGSNFLSGAMVNLTRKGYSNVTASNVAVSSSSLITGTLNLAGVSSGGWNVSVANSNGMIGSLANGFTVIPNITAKFFGVPGTIVKPLMVNFYDASDGSPTSWACNFGDGSSNATTKNATHIYSTAENSTVKPTIGDGN